MADGSTNRGFGRLWLGTGISAFGFAVTDVAIPLIAILSFGASELAVGALLAAGQAAWPVLGLLAGAWVDRWSRRRVLVVSQALRAALLMTVPIAAWTGRLTLAHLYVVALGIGALLVFTNVARLAYVPAVVGRDGLVRANSRLMTTDTAAEATGTSAAGVVIQSIGAPFALLLDVATSLTSAVSIRSVPVADKPEEPVSGRSLRKEVAQGLRYTFANPAFRTLTFASAAGNAAMAAHYTLALLLLAANLQLDEALIGILLTSGAIGGFVGAVATERLTVRWPSGKVWRAAMIVGPMAGLLVPATFSGAGLALFVSGTLGLSIGAVVTNVVGSSFRQALCPPHLLGRMSASSRVVSWGVIPLGALGGGALGTAIGTRPALWIVGGLFFVAPIIVRASVLRDVDDLADLDGLEPPGSRPVASTD